MNHAIQTSIKLTYAFILEGLIARQQGTDLTAAANSSARPDFDWDLVLDKANTFQLMLPVRNILTSIARNWRAPIPKQFLRS